jgi:hypothetical protein
MYCYSDRSYYGGEGALIEKHSNDRCLKHWVENGDPIDQVDCPKGSVIVGIKTKVDLYDPEKADNTGLEEIQFLCDKVTIIKKCP